MVAVFFFVRIFKGLPKVMRQTSEVLVPREDLPIRGAEETVGIEEKTQLSKGADEDLVELRFGDSQRITVLNHGGYIIYIYICVCVL